MFQSSERGVDRILNLEILSKGMEPSIRSDYSPVTGANSNFCTLRDIAVLSYVLSAVYYSRVCPLPYIRVPNITVPSEIFRDLTALHDD